MEESTTSREFDLGRSGKVIAHVSDDEKRLLLEFDVDQRGLNKTGVNSLIEMLKTTRKQMKR